MKPIIVASHPRSGTHFLIDLIRLNFQSSLVPKNFLQANDAVYFNIERLTSEHRRLSEIDFFKFIKKNVNVILKTHYDGDFQSSWIPDETGIIPPRVQLSLEQCYKIYIYRDPLSVLRSYHDFIQNFEKREIDIDFFIEGGVIERLVMHMESWLCKSEVFPIFYSDLVSDPFSVLDCVPIFNHGLSRQFRIPPHLRTIAESRIQRIFFRNPLSTAIVSASHFPKCVFNGSHKNLIRKQFENSNLPVEIKTKCMVNLC